ncbi:Glycosyl hydrolases family 16 [Geosmithia morbida]|uniref:Glycosyl hydrolases family 16 n=1 Tax=Geosmithia morbida TaxID=1094350 RepID=A0A9P5D015_9HYPO|nr:Glycosyl hydrolases family 16 [Geosmithia morbida]KAF4121127.1 Glycosyl hydrolases family 16 [Geosmithia morbida]
MKVLSRIFSLGALVASRVVVVTGQEDDASTTAPSVTSEATETQQPTPSSTPQPAEEKDCGCYVINGSNPTYYEKRLFYDFRDLSEYAGEVDDVVTDADDASDAPPSSKYFEKKDWKKTWKLSDWTHGIADDDPLIVGEHVPRVYSPGNVYVEEDKGSEGPDTYVSIRTQRVADFQSCGEFSSVDEYHFLSLRVLARTVGDTGGVTSIFTYRSADELADIQEADIEFITREADDRVHYVNNPAYTLEGENFPEATRNVSIPGNRTFSDWLVHRFDWTPERSIWYIDGVQTASIAFQVPRDPSRIVFNVWSDGGYWSGFMAEGDQAAFHIRWIEMVYNTTDPEGGSCHSVCSIDDPAAVNRGAGSIVTLWDNPASSRPRPPAWLVGWMRGCTGGAPLLLSLLPSSWVACILLFLVAWHV